VLLQLKQFDFAAFLAIFAPVGKQLLALRVRKFVLEVDRSSTPVLTQFDREAAHSNVGEFSLPKPPAMEENKNWHHQGQER